MYALLTLEFNFQEMNLSDRSSPEDDHGIPIAIANGVFATLSFISLPKCGKGVARFLCRCAGRHGDEVWHEGIPVASSCSELIVSVLIFDPLRDQC